MPVYEVKSADNRARVSAPNAASAALFFGIYMDGSGSPFAVHVDTEDGLPFAGDEWWYTENPSCEVITATVARVAGDLWRCAVIEVETSGH